MTNAIWNGPGSNWNDAGNWISDPVVPDETAFFDGATPTSIVFLQATTSIETIDFTAGNYTFTIANGETLEIDGFGITTADGLTENFVVSGNLNFNNGSTADAGVIITTNDGGTTSFTETSLGSEAAFVVNDGGTLQIADGFDVDIGSLAGVGSGGVNIGEAAILTVGLNSLDTTFAGSILGGADSELLKTGAGTLTLTGTSTVDSLTFCGCVDESNVLDINGGSFAVTGLNGSFVEFGTLSVSNGGAFETTSLFVAGGQLVVAGAGSTAVVTDVTDLLGFFTPVSLTIANGGSLDSQLGANIGSNFGMVATVTGPGSTWNVDGSLVVGGPLGLFGILNLINGGLVTADDLSLINGSTLNLGIGGFAGSIATSAIANDGQIVANFVGTSTLAAAIAGSGGLTKSGAGALILSGVNSYAGGTAVTAGTLGVTNGNALGTGLLALGEGTSLLLNGNFTLANAITVAGDPVFDVAAGTTATISGAISDASPPAPLGVVEKLGDGTLVLAGVNTYSGGTVISDGILQATNNSSVGSGAVALDGGVFQAGAAGLVFANAFAVNTTGGTVDTNGNSLTFSGAIGNGNGTGGTLTKIGAGALTLLGSNTYGGPTIINAGTLIAAANAALANDSDFTVNAGATLQIAAGISSEISTLTGQGSVVVHANSQFAVRFNAQTATFSGAISGDGAFAKQGSGTQVLAGNSSYAGGTLLDGGILDLAALNAAGSGAITFGTGSQTLAIESAAFSGNSFGNVIASFASGDTLDLVDLAFAPGAKATYDSASQLLQVTSKGVANTLTLANPAETTFAAVSDGAGGTKIVFALAGVTIMGTQFADRIDATHTVPGQPLPTTGDDTIRGRGGNDIINARAGNDLIQAGRGDDILRGQLGSDSLVGKAGDDALVAGAGNDWLAGGIGRNRLTGGTGDDLFVFDSQLGRGNAANPDSVFSFSRIVDFVVGEDLIALSQAIFTSIDNVFYNPNSGALRFDADLTQPGPRVHFATLARGLALTDEDFVLV